MYTWWRQNLENLESLKSQEIFFGQGKAGNCHGISTYIKGKLLMSNLNLIYRNHRGLFKNKNENGWVF